MIPVFQTGHPHSSAALVSSVKVAKPGQTFLVGIRMKMAPTWHTYWKNPGDSGIPISVKWTLPKGWTAGDILWPVPTKISAGGLANYAYENQALLLFRITPSRTEARTASLEADVKWLICQQGCVPAEQQVSQTINLGQTPMLDERNYRALTAAQASLPIRFSGAATARRTGDSINLTLLGVPSDILQKGKVAFFSADGAIDASSPQTITAGMKLDTLRLKVSQFAPSKITHLTGLLVSQDGAAWWHGKKAVSVDVNLESNSR